MTPTLDGRAWQGMGSYFGTTFVVELVESQKSPGFYHYATACGADDFWDTSKKPMEREFLQDHLNLVVSPLGLVIDDLSWREVTTSQLILMRDRIRAGH